MSTIRIFEAGEADPSLLQGKRAAVIGYGSQGHAHALNTRDSGADVVIGLARTDGPSAARAREAGFQVLPVADAVRGADFVAILIPDTVQAAVYHESIAPNLKDGAALLFAHGFNVHYGQISPPDNVDTILVAPKSPGAMVRREFESGRGVPALVGVHHDATGTALARALAWANALGSLRAGVLETTFAHETETDLFGEQAVLCGGLAALVRAGFDTLVRAGYAPELAYFECLHELKLIVDLAYAGGMRGMREAVSDTAEYGEYVAGDRVVNEESRKAMQEVLDEIRSGAFARRWIEESASGGHNFKRMREAANTHLMEDVGERLRSRMAWL